MTKLVICASRGSSFHFLSLGTEWRLCECGNTAARWLDPDRGTVAVAARDRTFVRVIGMHNQFLLRALTMGQMWDDVRDWHDIAIEAPGYVFDKSKARCWAVVCAVGSTSDTRWATEEEYTGLWPEPEEEPVPEQGLAEGS
jgi:hypothetical protein